MSEIKPWRECIEKHDAYIIMCNVLDDLCEKEAIKKTLYERLRQAPSTELERKKGHWIDIDSETYTWKVRCNKCGHERSMLSTQGGYPNFCENCGADMRGEKE